MKRIQAACIMQTLVFSQRPELELSPERAEKINRADYEAYRRRMDRTATRYQITSEEVRADGALVIRVRKEYNAKAPVEEYFA